MDDFNQKHDTVEGTVPQQDLPEYNMPQDFASNNGYRPPDSVTAPYQPVDYQQPQYQQPQYQQPQYQQPQAYGYEQPAAQPYGGYQQPAAYGYAQGQMPPRPETNLVWAILCTLFCCWPLGIVAIVNAAGVNSAYNAGNYEEAERKSKAAKTWAMWSAILGLIVSVIYVIVLVASSNY